MGDAIFLRGTFCTKNRGNRKNGLYKCEKCAIINKPCGGVAQLGERSVRIREVKGSNPSVSTKQVLDEHLFLQRRLRREMFALIHNRKAPSWEESQDGAFLLSAHSISANPLATMVAVTEGGAA